MRDSGDRQELINIIKRRSFSSGVDVKLASGRASSFYFNMKPTVLDPAGGYLVARAILDALAEIEADAIGGLEMGAVPIAAAVATESHAVGRPLPAFFVRKAAKDHGTQSLIEGLAPGETLAGKRIVIVEDVTTTGGSALKAAEAVKEVGGKVVHVITIVDREEGAVEAFKAAGVGFTALLTLGDFK
ncbi:MAG: Orotate phosphoribosyltransferase [Pseudomonadota bacterium]|jgi:orotate phosphoribosyltransferase